MARSNHKSKKNGRKNSRRPNHAVTAALIAVVVVLAALIGVLSGAAPRVGTPAATESDTLRISEVMTNNSMAALGVASASDWIEIENISDETVRLSGCALMRSSDPAGAFVFPDGEIAPGGFVVVRADGGSSGDGAYHAPFRLSASGEQLVLLDKNGNTLDSASVPPLEPDHVLCRDAEGRWQVSGFSTPGSANRIAAAEQAAAELPVVSGSLEITEVMTRNAAFITDDTGVCPDYVEIHNSSDRAVSLEGWYLSDERGNLLKWAFPAVTLEPDGYLLVWCSGTDAPGSLHASFRLSSDGEEILLTGPDGGLVSCVSAPMLNADQSYSLTDGEWTAAMIPTPGHPNTFAGADAAAAARPLPDGVILSEILASSAEAEWIELYNTSSQSVDLSGCWLSDNSNRPRKWQFPEGTVLAPGAYLGLNASGLGTGLNTSFRLSADGGYMLTLTDKNGRLMDSMYVPEQYAGISYGRADGQNLMRYFTAATPGTPNLGESWQGRAPRAVYSVAGGLFEAGDTFTVTLSAPSGCRIYYTTDTTDPDEASALYTGPITVSGPTILRTRVYRDGCMPSFTDTQSYLYDVLNADGAVHVVSLVSDPYNLTSDEAGILVRGTGSRPNYLMDWEREAHVEVFAPDGETLVSQNCGVRQQGQTTRAEPQQSLKLVARRQYGESLFHGKLFSRRELTEFNAFLLRTSNDDAHKVRMRDSILSGLADETSLMYQETEVCVVYLNGVYWGHYNIREAVNTHSICMFEGWEGDEDVIDLVVGNDAVMQGSDETFERLLTWMKQNNTNTPEAYQLLDSIIDIDNYIDYMCIQIFVGNTDPSNIKRYRNANDDGKWRWVVFDMDWGFNQDTNSVNRWLTPGGVGNGKRTDNSFFIACMNNSIFRDRFLTRLGDKMATTFTTENVLGRFEARYNLLKLILPDHFTRWDESESDYNYELRKIISYAQTRPARLLQFLKDSSRLGLTRAEMEHYFGAVMAQMNITYDQIPSL